MSVSTDGQICRGILFEEEFEFPWDHEMYQGDEEHWWRDINGYKPPLELYDAKGEYLNGVKPSDDQIKTYYNAQKKFMEENHLPFEKVNAQSGEYPLWILAVPGSCKTASRGYPEELDISKLTVDDEKENKLVKFCQKHFPAAELDVKWYLSSYWG
jgi:hypothetical protein